MMSKNSSVNKWNWRNKISVWPWRRIPKNSSFQNMQKLLILLLMHLYLNTITHSIVGKVKKKTSSYRIWKADHHKADQIKKIGIEIDFDHLFKYFTQIYFYE